MTDSRIVHSTTTPTSQLRWIVRLEADTDQMFGQTRREVRVWAVRPYVYLPSGRRRVGRLLGTYVSLRHAHNRARTEAATYYGDPHR